MKIKTIDELVDLFSRREGCGSKIVLCHGVFDILHIGHIRHLRAAKKFGDILIISITSDRYVNKGDGRPIFNQNLRAEALSALEFIDYVHINDFPTSEKLISVLKPLFYVKGDEYIKNISQNLSGEEEALKIVGGQMKYTNEVQYSSTNIFNKKTLPADTFKFIQNFKKKYSFLDFIKYFNSIKNLKVLVIGEVIIDKFCFGSHLGKMRRESLMEFGTKKTLRQVGGSGIVANHIANFVKNVTLFTTIGDYNSEKNFIKSSLNPIIETFFFTKKNSPTPSKIRYIEEHVGYRTVFKASEMNDQTIECETSEMMLERIVELLPKFDLVVVSDFGHGMIDEHLIDCLIHSNKFLAVNTQINTENRGFNTIDKYQRIDYACINEDELRVVMKDKHTPTNLLIRRLGKPNFIKKLSVTCGFKGSIALSPNEDLFENPPFSVDVLDTIGAGDAFFSITSLFAKKEIPIDAMMFVGNAVGAMQIKMLGNQQSIEKKSLLQYIENLLK